MNPPLNPVLRFIYLLLRIVSWLGVSVFYRRRIIIGRENLDFEGPAILVVNHPSTLMDVLNPCVHIRQESFFLANYGLFKNPVMNWILTRLYCIPVKRREDVAEGEARNNDAAFEKSYQHLEKKGLLFIAAEGVSWMERWVRPFKTGAARIAFGTEMRQGWQAGVKIVPIGLSYSAPNLFRSEVLVHFGKPMPANVWASAAQTDFEKAVDDFTSAIQQQVRTQVLDTRDEAGQQFMEQLEPMLRPAFPKDGAAYFSFRKNLIEQNLDNEPLRQQTAAYHAELTGAGVTEAGLQNLTDTQKWQDMLLLLLGAPFFLAGFIFWWLPCYLPGLLTRKMNLYIGYASNVKMLAGLFTFPLALFAAARLLSPWLNGWVTCILLLALGYFSELYLDAWQRRKLRRAAEALREKQPALFDKLVTAREAVLAEVVR